MGAVGRKWVQGAHKGKGGEEVVVEAQQGALADGGKRLLLCELARPLRDAEGLAAHADGAARHEAHAVACTAAPAGGSAWHGRGLLDITRKTGDSYGILTDYET